ncbi:MAG TPA: sugar phosphate isomerase/epimerase [Clostridia bacterium]|nr:sugar phosphate isomerase/epimerase [Clostridia bacterium]
MKLTLGTNCGFAINRYIEPEVWTRIVAKELGLYHVQFVADLLNPFLPESYIENQVKRLQKSIKEYGISVDSVFTSAFTRVNHLMNPDREARKIWLKWFKDFFTIASRLGAKSGGSHFGIMTFDTYNDPAKRAFIIDEAVKLWQELTFFAQDLGFECLIFEPISVEREMANTIEESLELMNRVNENCGVPMRICLDVGHAPHPSQRDPYEWITRLGKYSPVIHLQQTVMHRSNHWPFIPEYNEQGIIKPDKVIRALEESGAEEALLLFEISHREHSDTDYRVVEDLKVSAEYWRQYIKE